MSLLPSVDRGVARAVAPFDRGTKLAELVYPRSFPLTPLPSKVLGVSWVPKVCNLGPLQNRAHPLGPPGFCWRGGLPLGVPVLLSPQIHRRSPVSQELGFTRILSIQNSAAQGPLLEAFLVIRSQIPHDVRGGSQGHSYTRSSYTPVHTAPQSRRTPDILPWTASRGQPKAERMAGPWDLVPSAREGLVPVNRSCTNTVLTPDLWFGVGRKCIRSS